MRLPGARRVFDFIEEETETVDQKDAVVLSQVQGEVKLVDVSFSYQPEVPLLEHLNLTVKPGQKIAIVGPTGCGKTTLINLLMRFYDLDGGQILLDGNAVSKVTKDSLRASFGMVLQETWLKSGSIAENIAYGNRVRQEKRLLRQRRRRMPMDLSNVCRKDMIRLLLRMEAICHKDKSNFCVLQE